MKLKTEELIFHPQSTKYTKDNVEDLMRSIPIMGQLQPIIINRKKEVLKGNRILTALQLLKIKTVEVIISDFEGSDTLVFLQLRKNLHSYKILKKNQNTHLLGVIFMSPWKEII